MTLNTLQFYNFPYWSRCDIFLAKSTIQNGAFDFLSKPILEEELNKTIELGMTEAIKEIK